MKSKHYISLACLTFLIILVLMVNVINKQKAHIYELESDIDDFNTKVNMLNRIISQNNDIINELQYTNSYDEIVRFRSDLIIIDEMDKLDY